MLQQSLIFLTGELAVLVGVEVIEQKTAYKRVHLTFRKLLSASGKRIPISKIMNYIYEIVVDTGGCIVLKRQY